MPTYWCAVAKQLMPRFGMSPAHITSAFLMSVLCDLHMSLAVLIIQLHLGHLTKPWKHPDNGAHGPHIQAWQHTCNMLYALQ